MRRSLTFVLTASALLLAGCAGDVAEQGLPNALVLALASFEEGPDGPVPLPASLLILERRGDQWSHRTLQDPDSNVFHKAMAYSPAPGDVGVLTAGGTRAILKLWRTGTAPEVLWEKDFGGRFSRMREMEVGDIYGDGSPAIAVATHDQGVIAVVRPDGGGGWRVEELDSEPGTIVHEIELGDLDGDGVIEIYATPSLPNKLDGTPQPGFVTRYVPAAGEGRTVVADLGDRHAKEILAGDVDGDGRDELYVSVEAVAGGQVEILRFDADTPADGGMLIATLNDKLCRFLTFGDVDGDGVNEMVAATHKSGLWLLRPGDDPRAPWSIRSIDRTSSGFEHAAILTDLDEDGIDELYVADDKGAQVNEYRWLDGTPRKITIFTFPEGFSGFTWNITPVPANVIP